MNKLRIFIFLLLQAAISLATNATQAATYVSNPAVNKLFYEGFQQLYHFKFNDCSAQASLLIKMYPGSPWGHILKAEHCWWMIISGDEQNHQGQVLTEELGKAMQLAETLPERESLFCIIIAYSLNSRYALYKGQYVKAVELLHTSSGLLKASKREVETYEPFRLTQGLYEYFMAEAGKKFGIFNPLSIFGIDVSREKGLALLEGLTTSDDEILRTESRYFLMKIYAEIEKEPAVAAKYGAMLVHEYPQNQIFRYLYLDSAPEKKSQLPGITLNSQLTEAQQRYLQGLMKVKK
ncbi:MAG: hypothetical protein WCO63_00770 [Bacteroidota bacterium]